MIDVLTPRLIYGGRSAPHSHVLELVRGESNKFMPHRSYARYL